MPTEIRLLSRQETSARIARALLQGGILTEADWQGDVLNSLYAGLCRWICQEVDLREAAFLNVDLNFTDNMDGAWGLDTAMWHRNVVGPVADACELDQTQIGAFALTWAESTACVVGPSVQRLESVCRGFGYGALHLLTMALDCTTPCMTIEGARDRVGEWADYRTDEETDTDADDFMTVAKFDAMVPKAAWRHGFHPKVLQRAARTYARQPQRFGALDVAILDLCLELWALCETHVDTEPVHGALNQIQAGGLDFPLVSLIRWDKDDYGARCFDEHNDLVGQIESSDCVWLQGFLVEQEGVGPGTLVSAVENLKTSLRMVALCDRLMGLLHHSERLLDVFERERRRERLRV